MNVHWQSDQLYQIGIKTPKTADSAPEVSMYSCRNTFISRAERSGVRVGLRHYLAGHTNPETTVIHRGYTDGASINELLGALHKVSQVTDWNYDSVDDYSF